MLWVWEIKDTTQLKTYGFLHISVFKQPSLKQKFSDQNFVDEDRRDKSSHGSTVKRLKTAGVDALNNDKVSLLGRLNVKAISCASFEREELVHQEFLSEHPQSSASPRSNLHYFLRGS
ncbi:hypothetical protein Q3G72_031414 [Acer saccharum]|nr:hypothetical protein Q3G72_031414 [Acer saccharum]